MNKFARVDFKPQLRSDYAHGLQLLVYSFGKVMNREMVIRGFQCCGQDCKEKANGLTVDFDKMMHQCYTDISEEQLRRMREEAPSLMECVKAKGTCSLQDFLDHGIEPGTTTIDRTALSHVRHWSEIITHVRRHSSCSHAFRGESERLLRPA